MLAADIDLADSAYAAGWTPLPEFRGELHGQGHVISGLTISGSANCTFGGLNSCIGLFAETLSGAVIADLTITGSTFTNTSPTGATGASATLESSQPLLMYLSVIGRTQTLKRLRGMNKRYKLALSVFRQCEFIAFLMK